MQRRTRIVATLGPATDAPGVLEKLLQTVDVVRINFSHGTDEKPLERIARVRELSQNLSHPVAVLADLPGPKLRAVLDNPLPLTAGQEINLTAQPMPGLAIGLTEPELLAELRPGQRVLLDDGRLQMRVLRAAPDKAVLRVEVGGTLLPKKGINLPDTALSIAALTPRDREALAVAARAKVDWLALSFVREAGSAHELRAAARAAGLNVPILAKMERPEAVRHADAIIAAFDGIMVARGDLGVEMPLETVPHVQKDLIARARVAGKPVITATDMLDSMRTNPRPTRAEASDVANAVYDGTDAVMLSGETAVGQYPLEAVSCMNRILNDAEVHQHDDGPRAVAIPRGDFHDHITHLTCTLAHDVRAAAIIVPTMTGRTARLMARHRPPLAIVAPSADPAVVRQLALVWGLRPVPLPAVLPAQDRLAAAVRAAFVHRAVKVGDLVVVLAEHPIEGGARSPTIRLVRVGPEGGSAEP